MGRLFCVLAPISVGACSSNSHAPAPAPLPAPATSLPRGATPVQAAIALGTTPVAVDHGIPRLLQATTANLAPAATATGSARIHLARLAPAWGVKTMPALEPLGEIAVRGGTIVRLRQSIDGLPIEGGELRVFVRATGELVAVNGVVVGAETPRNSPVFRDNDAGAIARSIEHVYNIAIDPTALAVKRRLGNGVRVLAGRSRGIDVQQASAHKVWLHKDGKLVAAWVAETFASPTTSTKGDAFKTTLAGVDGSVLAHRSLVDDAFSYRVWAETTGELHPFDGPQVDASPHPTGVPDGSYPAFILPNLVTVDGLNHPATSLTPDPWLVGGKTETNGNNVDAYSDLNAPTGLTFGDFRATVTAPGVFDRTYDTIAGPLTTQTQEMAGITSLFYTMNWLHDFWYDRGFTEAAGNGQDNNFGRGGEDRDALLAEAQDNANGGSRNNANMSTPSDGLQPRMQVFLWSGKDDRKLTVSGRTPLVGPAAFGPQSFDATAAVALSDNGAGVTNACAPLVGSFTGKVVLVDRGVCSFKSKALNIQNAGGIGVILANNNTSAAPPSLGDDTTITTPITIGTLSVIQSEGVAIKADLVAGPVTGVLHRLAGPELDGTLDATVVAHEFGHYVHHRLSDCNTSMCGAMSEGWADFDALLTVLRPGDNVDAAYPLAIYSTVSFGGDPGYFGIRRAPYSTSQTINSLAFHHMSDGTALPTTHPFLVFGLNSEVHNAGEIWASVMWEAYVAIQKSRTDFDDARHTMADYVVAGLLMTPTDATPTETRDALLLAARASSVADHDLLAAAFARRGFGSCSVSPARDSTNFAGIVDSTIVAGRALPGAVTSTMTTSCDADNVLDGGETMHVTVPITNPGHKDLTNVVVALTSATPGVNVLTIPTTIATLPAYTTTSVEMDVSLSDTVSGPLDGNFIVKIDAAQACTPMLEAQLPLRLNVDDVAGSSATDAFDTTTSVWIPGGDAIGSWTQVRESALDGIWHGADSGTRSDTNLTSPAVTAGATDPVIVTFQHRFAFEFNPTGSVAFDGAVIEISTDGGLTFNDVSTLLAAAPYNGTITNTSDNPLATRPAFVNKNAANPLTDQVTLDFGTQLAGMTFQLRFRIATDSGTGLAGWEIDDVAFAGIVGTPFPAQVGDSASCTAPPDGAPDAGVPPADAAVGPDAGDQPETGDGGGCCDAGPIRAGNAAFALGVLAVLLRRRRRR
jgi:hypothetical protein